jgi:hypothetical protein
LMIVATAIRSEDLSNLKPAQLQGLCA